MMGKVKSMKKHLDMVQSKLNVLILESTDQTEHTLSQ